MSDKSRLELAAELLRSQYGRTAPATSRSTWEQTLRTLFGVETSHPANDVFHELIQSSILCSPRTVESATVGQLLECLKPIPRGPQKSSVVKGLAAWWLAQFEESLDPDWTRSLTHYRESLRAIRGLGPATVDEILLFAGHQRVFPVDRPTLRVAIRHGWLDFPIEDEQAQSFFVTGLESANVDPREFAIQLAEVGAKYCGREPKCDECPLRSLLPPNGPLNPDSC